MTLRVIAAVYAVLLVPIMAITVISGHLEPLFGWGLAFVFTMGFVALLERVSNSGV
jgi:hypothetical protein